MHQRFVRDFLQPSSPYRGLLLYHGLGVGKTCASIAIADVLRPPNTSVGKVFVMLPAFLRGNFVEEVKKCGDPRFLPDQDWEVVGDVFVRSSGGKSYDSFTPEDRDKLKSQIDRDILLSYNVIHYNGLGVKGMHALCEGDVNIFDDSVVIVDEAPNAISRVMHGKLFANVYQRIMDADRCKVVLLSGTPLVNMPLELAFMTNLTHGYIRELSFTSVPSSVDVMMLEKTLAMHPSVDHASSEVLVEGSRVNVTLLPSGFIKDELTTNVISSTNAPRPDSLIQILRETASSAAGVFLKEPILQNRFILPIDQQRFTDLFVDSSGPSVAHREVLERRLLGTVSVYSSTDPSLMPAIRPAKIIRVPMSDIQYEEYLIQRDIERRKERTAARFAAASAGNMTGADETKNLYRAFSRSVCTFVFPEGIKRPYRRDIYRAANDVDADEDENDTESPISDKKVDRIYDKAIDDALDAIYKNREKLLTVGGDLQKLSPKYLAIVKHLLDPDNAQRPAIIYSQFRRAEGLGLLRLALIANGFAELRVSKKRGSLTVEVFPMDANPTAPRFIVYGNEDTAAAVSMLNIFNSQLDGLPSELLSSLTKLLAKQFSLDTKKEENRYGSIARLLLITQSGSEGISTRNVREVHVIEPFWHANRILQVVGRAARANSHKDLPVSEKNVDVFVYAATFTENQAADFTITKLDKKRTSDEHILAVATEKRGLLDKFTDVMRRSAVDCVLHHPRSAGTRCFAHSATVVKKGEAALSYFTDIDVDIASQGRKVHLVPFIMRNGRKALANPLTGDVFEKNKVTKEGRLKVIERRHPSSVRQVKD